MAQHSRPPRRSVERAPEAAPAALARIGVTATPTGRIVQTSLQAAGDPMRVWRSRDLRLWRGVVPAELLLQSLLAAGGILAVVALRRLARTAPLRFTGACPGGACCRWGAHCKGRRWWRWWVAAPCRGGVGVSGVRGTCLFGRFWWCYLYRTFGFRCHLRAGRCPCRTSRACMGSCRRRRRWPW